MRELTLRAAKVDGYLVEGREQTGDPLYRSSTVLFAGTLDDCVDFMRNHMLETIPA